METSQTKSLWRKNHWNMNEYIKTEVKNRYDIDVDLCHIEDLNIVEEINVSDKTMDQTKGEWDFSSFPNLRRIDCSYNPITKLDVSKNILLEQIRWEGTRGTIDPKLDLSNNIHLRKISAGQDGIVELDLTHNIELEELRIFLNSSMRWINIDNCVNLRKIHLNGVNIPFVDLTNCLKLEEVDINYMNLYRNRDDEFGPGYPRPIVFVNENFDESIIPNNTRQYKYYTYYLVRVTPNSPEKMFLNRVKSMKDVLTSIPEDRYGRGVATMHYALLDIYANLKDNIQN